MKISVIITVFNLSQFIDEAIISVLSQTLQAFEIIVVNDGSEDDSIEKINKYRDKVKIINLEKNIGVLPATIEGLKVSSGEIIAFLDGDDVWHPTKLKKILNAFNTSKEIMLVTHQHEWVDINGKSLNKIDSTHKNIHYVLKKSNSIEQLDYLLKSSILSYKGVWLGSAFCIRRRDFNLSEFISIMASQQGFNLTHQDQPLAAFMIVQNPGLKICLIDESLFKYRVYHFNSSGNTTNLASAIKTINRSMTTVKTTMNIISNTPKWSREYNDQVAIFSEQSIISLLYERKYFKAISLFKKNINVLIRKRKFVKELYRLILIVCLGPIQYLKLKSYFVR
jgi:glycosyltransferase involved in cell wall biosynthesis